MGRPALQDRAAEQALGPRHREQRADAHRTGGLAGDGHRVRVAAERRDVVAHPLERRDLVEQAEVGRRASGSRAKPSAPSR